MEKFTIFFLAFVDFHLNFNTKVSANEENILLSL